MRGYCDPATGTDVLAAALQPGDIVHLEEHQVDGRTVGRRTLDAVVERVRVVCGHPVVDWRGCARFPGGSARRTGSEVYGPSAHVLVIGHLALAA